jgi:hypothetical protein
VVGERPARHRRSFADAAVAVEVGVVAVEVAGVVGAAVVAGVGESVVVAAAVVVVAVVERRKRLARLLWQLVDYRRIADSAVRSMPAVSQCLELLFAVAGWLHLLAAAAAAVVVAVERQQRTLVNRLVAAVVVVVADRRRPAEPRIVHWPTLAVVVVVAVERRLEPAVAAAWEIE